MHLKKEEDHGKASIQLGLGFDTTLSIGPVITKQRDQHQLQTEKQKNKHTHNNSSDITTEEDHEAIIESFSPSLKANNNTVLELDLLPHTPASFPWHPPLEKAATSSRGFQMDLSRRGSVSGKGHDQRASDEDENNGGSTRKKLRLSKEQSAFLEESFKEHSTLNPKQKIALAKQLHLHPRQVEVWFQNRRARTKLKQTEMDCEYLKRCCDTLKEENRRLQKEIQELRALKTSNPFYIQSPATTLTMCPSCERVATNSISNNTGASTTTAKTIDEPTSKAIGFPRFNPFHPTNPQHLELN